MIDTTPCCNYVKEIILNKLQQQRKYWPGYRLTQSDAIQYR